ncbi:MAG: PD-(D/E)XK nuclease family protein [Nanoarchaeota archaeon]
MTYKLSPSSISLMEECQRCFWLDKHNMWKRPSGIFPSLPSGMDNILKKHFNKFRDKNLLPPELCNDGNCENMGLFGRDEDEKELLSLWQNNLKGIWWEDEDGNILFGAVDNILVKDDKLIVLDYKTRGYKLKENTTDYYKNQMDIYNFLLRKNGYDTEDFSFLLFYVPSEVSDTGEVLFDTTLKKIPINIKNAEFLFEKALILLDGDCPNKKCEWCENVELR